MNQLIDEYFKRDLTEAEEEQLAQWISSNPEGAQLFIDRMEEHYRALGLPEPAWEEGPLPSFFPKSGQVLRKLLWAVLFLFLAWLGYSIYRLAFQKEIPPPAPAQPQPKVSGEIHKSRPYTKPVTPTKASPSKVNQGNKIHEELSVVVSNPQEGLVTVKVADSQGNEIRVLYAGILPAGEHTFTWDGKGESGLVASPGVYDLVVTSGTKVLHQKVRLGVTR